MGQVSSLDKPTRISMAFCPSCGPLGPAALRRRRGRHGNGGEEHDGQCDFNSLLWNVLARYGFGCKNDLNVIILRQKKIREKVSPALL
jgi:hypothetical protein